MSEQLWTTEERQAFEAAHAEITIAINRAQEKHDLRNSDVLKILIDLMHKRAFPRDPNEA